MSSQERALRVAQQQISNQRMVKAMINSELTTLRAENERLQAAVDKVLALHIREWITHDGIDGAEGCDVCGAGWPCDTRVALTQGGEGS